MTQQVLDSLLKRQRRRRAARAGAAHGEVHDAGIDVEALEDDVAAIVGDGGADTRRR